MFDKLGEMTKLAQQAQQIQAKQDQYQQEQLRILREISGKLSEVIQALKNR